MALNEMQKAFVAEIRRREDAASLAESRFEGIGAEFYADRQAREWLVAIDATNKVGSDRWYSIMVEGLLRHSGWMQKRMIKPEGLFELEDHTRDHGVGEYVIELTIAMAEDCRDLTHASEQITRGLLKAHFNGIQPITEHALFVLKRFIDPRRPASEEDLELLLWLVENSKGLDNDTQADEYLARVIGEALEKGGRIDRTVQRKLYGWLESREELGEAERIITQRMSALALPVPAALVQGREETSRELGAGSATRA